MNDDQLKKLQAFEYIEEFLSEQSNDVAIESFMGKYTVEAFCNLDGASSPVGVATSEYLTEAVILAIDRYKRIKKDVLI